MSVFAGLFQLFILEGKAYCLDINLGNTPPSDIWWLYPPGPDGHPQIKVINLYRDNQLVNKH